MHRPWEGISINLMSSLLLTSSLSPRLSLLETNHAPAEYTYTLVKPR